ncbi:hypothetical protein [Chitinophaga eiseniae]|uniref:YD repeat-containing protein n=1 Tax=Chitinophaga eiseniae TaxID=634771 RepID=A0A847SVE1_9BACT|nr:hypothetical protein [Chitinophaga eiseniae]NLR82066.1 hypothetical protein [Chitinophaga eiseniae]
MRVFKKLIIACALVFLFLPFRLLAQENATGSSNGDASTIAQQRNTAISVNLFTGIPQVYVPLFTYDRGALSLNIGLNYFAGGVQVNEDAPESGLSWNLNAGGVVMRSVRGVPDDYPQVGYLNLPAYPTTMADSTRMKYYDNKLDAQADIFTFNFDGASGRFVIAKDRSIKLIEQKNLKIVPEFTSLPNATYSLTGFIITKEDGTRYEFRDIDLEKFDGESNAAIHEYQYYPIAWNLTRIIAPFNEDTISFKYKIYDIQKSEAAQESITFDKNDQYYNSSFVIFNRRLNRIQDIVMPGGQSVSIIRSMRPDDYGETIKSVALYSNGQVRDKFRFDYTIYDASNNKWIDNFYFGFGVYLGEQDSHKYRAFLKRIVKETPQGQFPYYSFVYNTDYLLPSKGIGLSGSPSGPKGLGSNSRDHWGFYNGKPNSTGIPSVTGFQGADREPSSTFVLAGSLKKVVSPEGMIREYTFESHDRVGITNAVQEVNVSANSPGSYSLNLSQYYTSKHQLNIRLDPGADLSENPPAGCTYSFYLKNSSGQTIDSKTYSFDVLNNTGDAVWDINAPSGTYTVTVQKSGGCTLPVSASLVVSWNNNVVNAPKVIGGGIRIKKVTTYPGNNSAPPITSEYKYVMPDGVTSSGYMAQLPKYEYTRPIVYTDGTMREIRIASSDPINNLKYVGGNPIGYSRVEVLEGGQQGNNGKTVYEFSDFRDINYNQVQAEYPYLQIEKADWGLGLPKKVSTYDNAGKLKKEIINTYNIIQAQLTDPSVASAQLSHVSTSSNGIFDVKKLRTDMFYPLIGRTELLKTQEITHYDNSGSTTNTTSFTYSPVHFNVKTIVQDLDAAKGLSIEKRCYYNTDYTITGGVFQTFKDKSITQLMATEEWITGDADPRMTGGEVVEYQSFNNIIRPYRNYTFAANAPVALSVAGAFSPAVLVRGANLFTVNAINTQYDNQGFLQTSQKEGRVSAILLGPDKQGALMRVQNANYSDVAYTSFETSEKGNFSYSGNPVVDDNALTGQYIYNLSGGAVTSANIRQSMAYSLSLWFRGSEPVVTGAAKIAAFSNTKTGWTLNEYKVNQATISISGTALVDEIRLFPVGAVMRTQTYESSLGVTSECGVDNQPVYYSYDVFKRLVLVRNQNRQIITKKEYGANSVLHTNPVWDTTGVNRCQTDKDGVTGILEIELTDINTNSATWGATKWVTAGNSYACIPAARYEPTGRKRCIVTSDGNNTGGYDIEQRNVNPHSSTYGAYLWVYGGIDNTMCRDLCIGEFKKIINGKCETGKKVYIESEPQKTGWRCIYQYEFSDGTTIGPYDEYSPSPCM